MELYLLVASGLYCAWQMVKALDFGWPIYYCLLPSRR